MPDAAKPDATRPDQPRNAATAKRSERAGYHHGNLRAALIDTAIELLEERGIQGFSLAEASRRLGVAQAAPYRHFADRDELLVAVAIRAGETLGRRLEQAADPADPPEQRLAAMVRAFAWFAHDHRPLFQALFAAGLNKNARPELAEVSRQIMSGFLDASVELCGGVEAAARGLTGAIGATAHGHAILLLEGGFGSGQEAVERAATLAQRATRALVAGREVFGTDQTGPPGA